MVSAIRTKITVCNIWEFSYFSSLALLIQSFEKGFIRVHVIVEHHGKLNIPPGKFRSTHRLNEQSHGYVYNLSTDLLAN